MKRESGWSHVMPLTIVVAVSIFLGYQGFVVGFKSLSGGFPQTPQTVKTAAAKPDKTLQLTNLQGLTGAELFSMLQDWDTKTAQEKQRLGTIADEWFYLSKNVDGMPPLEKQKYMPLVKGFFQSYVRTMFATSKPEWEKLNNGQQIVYCSVIKSNLEGAGFSKSEASGFSLYVGPFMNAAPSQATFEDAVVAYVARVNARMEQQSMAAVKNVLDFSLTAAQIIQTLNDQQR